MCYFDWTSLQWHKPQFINLSSVIYQRFLLVWGAQDHLSLVFSCWVQQRREPQVVLVDGGAGVGGVCHKLHSTLSCHPCSVVKLLCVVSRQLKLDLALFFSWANGLRVSMFDECQSCVDRQIRTPPWGYRQLCHTPHRWKNFRPLKITHLRRGRGHSVSELSFLPVVMFLWTQGSRLNILAQTHLMKIKCQNQMLIRHVGRLDKATLVLLSLG